VKCSTSSQSQKKFTRVYFFNAAQYFDISNFIEKNFFGGDILDSVASGISMGWFVVQ